LRTATFACALASAICSSLVSPVGSAATVKLLTLAELVEASDLVVLAVPGKARAMRGKGPRVLRRVPLEVEQRVTGTAPAAVEVVLLGGELDGVGTLVPGEAELPAGEPSLLFLEALPGEPGAYRVTGLAQGRFAIVRDPASGARFAARTLGEEAVPPPGDLPDDPDDLGVGRPRTCLFVPLDLLLDRIRALVAPGR